jgi:inorganic triphosphatase YgiF
MRLHLRQPVAFQEVELKLSLLHDAPQSLAKLLARVPVLARRNTTHQILHNIYYDTPDQRLRQQCVVLRLRRVGDESSPQWLQTLKTDTSDSSALSQRGEWENPLAGAELSRQALQATPWSGIDADGSLFAALKPCFVTAFERTAWLVHRRDGSVVEVALDLGQIEASGQFAPICELELELKSGEPSALFEIAYEIAQKVAILPAIMSKAQRGFLLAQDSLNQPCRAQKLRFTHEMSIGLLAQQVLRSAFAQFSDNLDSLRVSDDPEVVHQARIGWRRFRSALHFFKKSLPVAAPIPSDALLVLLTSLGELRNLDVARSETLPSLAGIYVLGDERRAKSWQAMTAALMRATDHQRETVRQTLLLPAVGASLLTIVRWLEVISVDGHLIPKDHNDSLPQWAKHRIQRLKKQLRAAHELAYNPEQWHRVRILSKRLRYNNEALQSLLSRRLARQCAQLATAIQDHIGAVRDIAQLSALMAKLDCDPCLAEYLRGVAAGSARQ